MSEIESRDRFAPVPVFVLDDDDRGLTPGWLYAWRRRPGGWVGWVQLGEEYAYVPAKALIPAKVGRR